MILKFTEFINENSKEDTLFDTVKKNQVVMYAGARFKVKDLNPDGAHELEAVKAKAGEKPSKVKLNRAQFNQKCREIND
jgi:hypothetical protein